MDLIVKGAWTGAAGEDQPVHITYHKLYLYCVLDTSPVKVVKIDPLTMLTVATWTAAVGVFGFYDIVFDDDNFYYGSGNYDGRVIKVSLSTMTTVATWVDPLAEDSIRDLILLNGSLYASFFFPAVVIKINPVTMTTVASWSGPAGAASYFLATDKVSVFAGAYNISPGKVYKLDVVTDPNLITLSGTWTGAAGDLHVRGICFDGTYIIAALWTRPGRLIWIDISSMGTSKTFISSEWFGIFFSDPVSYPGYVVVQSANGFYNVVIYFISLNEIGLGITNCAYPPYISKSGKKLYLGYSTSPAEVHVFSLSSTIQYDWVGSPGQNSCSSIYVSGRLIFAALYTIPAQVVNLEVPGRTDHLLLMGVQ